MHARPRTGHGPRRRSDSGPRERGVSSGVRCTEVQVGRRARSIGPRSLSATTPKTQWTATSRVEGAQAREQHLDARGVVGPVQQHGGLAAQLLQICPGQRALASPVRRASGETGTPLEREQLQRRERHRRVLELVRPAQAQGEALQRERPAPRRRGPPPGGRPGRSPGPRGAAGAPTSPALRSMAARASGSWRLTTTGTPGLRMPAFSPAIAPRVWPRYSM